MYNILPSLAESLRLNKDWKAGDFFLSPRSVQRRKTRLTEIRGAQRRRETRTLRQKVGRGQGRRSHGKRTKRDPRKGDEHSSAEFTNRTSGAHKVKIGAVEEAIEGKGQLRTAKPADDNEMVLSFGQDTSDGKKREGPPNSPGTSTSGICDGARKTKSSCREARQLFTMINNAGDEPSTQAVKSRSGDGGKLASSRGSFKRSKQKPAEFVSAPKLSESF